MYSCHSILTFPDNSMWSHIFNTGGSQGPLIKSDRRPAGHEGVRGSWGTTYVSRDACKSQCMSIGDQGVRVYPPSSAIRHPGSIREAVYGRIGAAGTPRNERGQGVYEDRFREGIQERRVREAWVRVYAGDIGVGEDGFVDVCSVASGGCGAEGAVCDKFAPPDQALAEGECEDGNTPFVRIYTEG